jgi:5-methylcytosine-specific restriction endonuclease McrA
MTAAKREALRMMFGGRCAYCGCELTGKWQKDHIKPLVRFTEYGTTGNDGHYVRHEKPVRRLERPENDCAENLYPACRACNINKSSRSVEQYRKFLLDGPESLASYNGRFRHMLRFGIVAVNKEPFQFWFERYRQEQAV